MTADVALEGDLSRRVDLYFSRRGVADVTWDANWNVVHIEAHGLHTAESRAILDSAIDAMTDHQGSRWLVDGRDMHAIKPSHQEWITENLLPRALAAGLRVAAIVIPRDAEAMMNIDDMAKAADDEIDVRYFSTVEKAREWLAASARRP
jgi:SpoIIAA-like